MKRAILQSVFGHTDFRSGQEELVDAVVAGRDLLGVMATGSGKSLCYQLPVLITKGQCLVVSPLISLIDDQVKKLQLSGIPAAALHSNLSTYQRDEAYRKWESGELRFLYIAPERFAQKSFLESLRYTTPQYVVIDEAHCIAQWGHDFRPDYLALGVLKKELNIPMVAFTATATPEVQNQIVQNLHLENPLVRVHGFYRPNLAFSAVMEGSPAQRLALMKEQIAPEGATVIYCATRKRVDEVTAALKKQRLPVYGYHAGMDADEREAAHKHFRTDSTVVLVATNAFGMGIDRPDVRSVIHAQMPATVEAYYQEAGRAGRDGLPARCTLYHSPQDEMIQEFLIEKNKETVPPEKVQAWETVRRNQLQLMHRYAYSSSCRQHAMMDYFGDKETLANGCGTCDNCTAAPAQEADASTTEMIRVVLSGAARLQGRFGAGHLVHLVMGFASPQIKRYAHDQLPTFGRLKDHSKAALLNLVQALVRQGYLKQEGLRYPTLQLSEAGVEVMHTRRPALIGSWERNPSASSSKSAQKKMSSSTPLSEADETLRQSIRTWRAAQAKVKGVPPYTIFWDKTLDDLCRKRPQTRAALREVWGLGEAKCKLFGSELLEFFK